MMRRRGDGRELRSRSYLGQCNAIQRNNRRRDSHKHRIQSSRSRRIEGSGFKPAVPSRLFRCDRAFYVGLGGEGSIAYNEVERPSEGVLGTD